MKYLKNAWYVAALANEVKRGELFKRKLFEQNIIFYRKQDDTPVAMIDRCPHRFAPLHMGRVDGDDVVCHYHALKFDSTGTCVHNPHGDGKIPPKAVVQTFPSVERYGLIWIWPGDSAQADPVKIPDYQVIDDGPATGVGHGYMKMECNYELIADNVMDLSHVDFIHGPIIHTQGKLSPQKPGLVDEGNTVVTSWEWEQHPAMGLFADFLPAPAGPARQYVNVTWCPPCNMVVHVGATQSKAGFDDALNTRDHHMMTPESEFSTHYFLVTRRNYMVDSAEYNEGKLNGMIQAFLEEDAPVVAAIQKEMGDKTLDEMRPVYLSGDPGPVRCRRKLAKLIAQEQQI